MKRTSHYCFMTNQFQPSRNIAFGIQHGATIDISHGIITIIKLPGTIHNIVYPENGHMYVEIGVHKYEEGE